MPQGKALQPAQKELIALLIASGVPQSQVATTVGCAHQTISDHVNHSADLKARIDELSQQYVSTLAPKVFDLCNSTLNRVLPLIRSGDSIRLNMHSELLKLVPTVIKHLERMAGIGGNNTLLQIYTDNRTQVINPVVLQALGLAAGQPGAEESSGLLLDLGEDDYTVDEPCPQVPDFVEPE